MRAHHHGNAGANANCCWSAQGSGGNSEVGGEFEMTVAKKRASTKVGVRSAVVERVTAETRISLHLTLEGRGQYEVSTGIRFFDHMLELFTRHGAFDLELKCDGDLDVDQHHTVEDVGIALGEAFDRA